jgi:uncharacterized membrane protein YfcA
VFLAVYAVYMLSKRSAGRLKLKSGPATDALVGFIGGLLGGVTAMPGAVPTIWCDLRGLSKDQQRGFVQPYIAAMQVAALGMLAAQKGLPAALGINVLLSIAPLAAGVAVGLALFGRMSDSLFRRAMLCVLFASGLGYLV